MTFQDIHGVKRQIDQSSFIQLQPLGFTSVPNRSLKTPAPPDLTFLTSNHLLHNCHHYINLSAWCFLSFRSFLFKGQCCYSSCLSCFCPVHWEHWCFRSHESGRIRPGPSCLHLWGFTLCMGARVQLPSTCDGQDLKLFLEQPVNNHLFLVWTGVSPDAFGRKRTSDVKAPRRPGTQLGNTLAELPATHYKCFSQDTTGWSRNRSRYVFPIQGCPFGTFWSQ